MTVAVFLDTSPVVYFVEQAFPLVRRAEQKPYHRPRSLLDTSFLTDGPTNPNSQAAHYLSVWCRTSFRGVEAREPSSKPVRSSWGEPM
jgi:hypothetical protein